MDTPFKNISKNVNFIHKLHFFRILEHCLMDSDNSNRKTSYFHAQKILDAAADIKAKKSRGVRIEERDKMILHTFEN